MVHQVAAGNINTSVLCVDQESKETLIIQMGMCAILNEEHENDDLNLCLQDDLPKLEDIPSLPFSIDFMIPVVKLTCGDCFAGILTAEGQVFTWGYN